MNSLYKIAGLTKQALHQYETRQSHLQLQGETILTLATEIRREHPKNGMSKNALLNGSGLLGTGLI